MNEEFDSKKENLLLLKENEKEHLDDASEIVEGQRNYFNAHYKRADKISDKLKFSGDKCFNLSDRKVVGLGRGHKGHINSFLEPSDYDELENISKYDESLENLALMPVTGNLQAVKKGIGNDRLDVFVFALHLYYSSKIKLIFNHCSYENIESLKSFLDCFDNVYEYCEYIYKISDISLVNDMIELGSQAIDDRESAKKFMNIIKRFMESRSEISNEIKN